MKLGDRVLDLLGRLPSTNTRIAATILLALGTGVKIWVSSTWEPTVQWLSFLVAMSGIDAAQFYGKRKTFAETEKIKADAAVKMKNGGTG
jgi:hypothetical protein